LYADGFTVRETDGNGFVYQVDVLDTNSVLHTVWSGTDPSFPGSPVDFSVNFARTTYLVQGLKVYTDTNHNLSAWEEIDAIQLRGDPNIPGAAVPEPGTLSLALLGGLGLGGYGWCRRKRVAAA
jgi:PEP-CTERM motif